MAAIANPLAGPSALRDIINPQFHQNNFPEELFVKQELGIKLDKGLFTAFYTSRVTWLRFLLFSR